MEQCAAAIGARSADLQSNDGRGAPLDDGGVRWRQDGRRVPAVRVCRLGQVADREQAVVDQKAAVAVLVCQISLLPYQTAS